jgi:molybdate transport system regulatory protein
MSSHQTGRAKRAALTPRVKVWLETEGRYAFGFGISEILQAVDRVRSIKRAAADQGKSYPNVWGRIKKAERTLGLALVETQVGGPDVHRSSLTVTARAMVADFLRLRRAVTEALDRAFARCWDRPSGKKSPPS